MPADHMLSKNKVLAYIPKGNLTILPCEVASLLKSCSFPYEMIRFVNLNNFSAAYINNLTFAK